VLGLKSHAKYKSKVAPYEIPFRPAYELHASAVWAAAGLGGLSLGLLTGVPLSPLFIGAGVAGYMAWDRYKIGTVYRQKLQDIRGNGGLWFLDRDSAEVIYQHAREKQAVWYGRGFRWNKKIR